MDITSEEILSQWKEDTQLDESDLLHELIKVPKLHSKYIGYYVHFKRKQAQAEAKKNKMAFVKRKYYKGECTFEELQKYGWEQYQGLKASASEFNLLMEIDPDMADYNHVVAELKTTVSCLEYVLQQLKSREFSIKAMLDYQKFLAGAWVWLLKTELD